MSLVSRARAAGVADREQVLALLAMDPVESVPVSSWLSRSGIERGLRSGNVWLHGESLCFSGANLLPVNMDADAARAFADMALRQGRRCSSIVGRLPATADLWRMLEPRWGPARAVRQRQFVMVTRQEAPITSDPMVRHARTEDLEEFFAASVEMYTEEIGASPIAHDGGSSYRYRIAQLIRDGFAFVRVEDGRVIFKAELGAVSGGCAQLQGVWVHPDRRGEGIGSAATAGVLRLARGAGMTTISLAVNDFNIAAVRSYLRCGFEVLGAQMVVLF